MSTNMVVYFDWKTVIYIYVCRQCRTQFILPNLAEDNSSTGTFTTGKSVMRLYPIDKSLVC